MSVFRSITVLMLLVFLTSAARPLAPAPGAAPVRIGVLAFRPKPQTLGQWRPLAAALKKAIPDHEFIIEALTYPELNSAVTARTLDFVLTNPGHYVLLARRNGLSAPLATVEVIENGRQSAEFGGVMFTRAGISNINTLQDVKGKTIAVASTESLGGYLAQALVLSQAGVHLPQDVTLITTGVPHDNVIAAVLSGRAEVGFVRTGVLEGMMREAKLTMNQIRILHPQSFHGFSLLVSTGLYPEWPFAAMPGIDENLARRVAASLFLMEEDTSATHALGIHGFVVPADYSTVEDLLRELRLPPFDTAPQFTLNDVTERYRLPLWGAVIICGLIGILMLRLHLANRKVDEEKRRVLLAREQYHDSEEQSKKALRESEGKFRAVFENAKDGILLADQDGTLISVNDSFASMHGYHAGELIGKNFKFLDTPDTHQFAPDRMQRLLAGESMTLILDHNCKDGRILPLEISANLVTIGGQKYILAFNRDITDRERANRTLLASEEKFRKAFMMSPDAININRLADGMYVSINKGFTEIMGYTEEDIIGKTSIELNIWEHAIDRQKLVDGLMKDGVVQNLEARFRGKNNTQKDGMMSAAVLELEGVKHILSITRDITERKKQIENLQLIEARLRQSEKMDAIGQLAGGIAHDFNNVLGGIIGYTDLSLGYAEQGSPLQKNLFQVLKASDRAKHLVKQILTFSRRGNSQKSITAIQPIVKEVLELLRSSIPSSVIIESDLRKDTKLVLADPTQIHQALLNLATNAVHAMNRKGTLRVGLYSARIDRGVFGRSGEIAAGEYTVIEIADTGCGMDAVTLSKAFEPFFTTKPVGEGTGLGLSVVLGVVQSNGGDIVVESEVGKGTTIWIYLPVTEDSPMDEHHHASRTGFTGSERILFVDDEKMLVDMAVNILTPLGYAVTGLSDSLDAFKFIQERGSDIDILITDQTMPGLTGLELAIDAHKIRKDLPIILCTGFSNELNPERASSFGVDQLVMKPYGSYEISKSIRDVLDKKIQK